MHFVGMAGYSLIIRFKLHIQHLTNKYQLAMKLTDPDGKRIEIRYRLDLTLVSLVVVIILSYIGFYISSLDKAFTKDKSEIIDKFIKDARTLTIQVSFIYYMIMYVYK
jgi:NO-binding membrane sensor protein with MHYT domain